MVGKEDDRLSYLGETVTFQGLLLLNFGREVTTWKTILYHFLQATGLLVLGVSS